MKFTSSIATLAALLLSVSQTSAQETTVSVLNISDGVTSSTVLTGAAATSYLSSQSARQESIQSSVSADVASAQASYGNSGINNGNSATATSSLDVGASATSAMASVSSAASSAASSATSQAAAASAGIEHRLAAMAMGAGAIGAVAVVL